MKALSHEQLLRHFSKMPDTLRCNILEKSFQRYYVLKSRSRNGLNRSELLYQALLFALESHHTVLNTGSAKKNSRELTTLEEKFKMQVKTIKASQKNKKPTKSNKLQEKYAPLIYRLKEKEQLSFTQIQAFLAKYHSLSVDDSLIKKLYPAIKQKVEDLKEAAFQENTSF